MEVVLLTNGLIHSVSLLLPVEESARVHAGGPQQQPPQRLHPADPPAEATARLTSS